MKFSLHPGIQGAVDGKVQWLELLTTNFVKPDDEHFFGTKIASMHGAVVEKNMRCQMQTDGQFFNFIDMINY